MPFLLQQLLKFSAAQVSCKIQKLQYLALVFFAVGSFNGTAATKYCMDIKEVNLDGPMFSDSEEKMYARRATNLY